MYKISIDRNGARIEKFYEDKGTASSRAGTLWDIEEVDSLPAWRTRVTRERLSEPKWEVVAKGMNPIPFMTEGVANSAAEELAHFYSDVIVRKILAIQ